MNRTIRRLLTALLVLFMFSYCGYMLYRYLYNPYKTEAAYEHTVSDSYRARAVMLRDETLVFSDVPGVISYTRPDAAVVMPGSPVAAVYTDEADLRLQEVEAFYDRELSDLIEVQGSTTQYLGTDTISKQIDDLVGTLVDHLACGDLDEIAAERAALQKLLNRKQVSIGREGGFAERISYLQAERDYARSNMRPSIGSVVSPASGYFCSRVDGFESLLSASKREETSIEDYKRAVNRTLKPEPSGAIGRVMQGHNWYIAVVVPDEELKRFETGATVSIDFGFSGHEAVYASVDQILDGGKEMDDNVVIFKTDRITEELIVLRHATVNINFRAYTGLRVRREAIRFDGQTEGVYVIEGGVIVFKPIEKLYEDESYVLCASNSDFENSLRLFDEVIVEGTNISAGKIVQ